MPIMGTLAKRNDKPCARKRILSKSIDRRTKIKYTEKSKIRTRVNHVFDFMEKSRNQMYLQCIGFKRIITSIGLMNLTYNMFKKSITNH